MKRLVFFVLTVSFLFAQNHYLVWMGNTKSPYFKVFKKVRNLYFKDYSIKIKKDYLALYSVIDNPEYYTDNVKYIDGLFADSVFSSDGYYDVLRVSVNGNVIEIDGAKVYKDGARGRAVRFSLRKKFADRKNFAKTLASMLYFYIKYPIYEYKTVNGSSISPVIIKNKKIDVYYYAKNSNVILFSNKVNEDYVSLAKKLNLIDHNDPKEFCNLLNMTLPEKNEVNDDEVTFEDYLLPTDFKSGFIIYEEKNKIFSSRPFRCQFKNYLRKLGFNDYVLNKLGIRYEISANIAPVAGDLKEDIQNSKSIGVYVALTDKNGNVEEFNASRLINQKQYPEKNVNNIAFYHYYDSSLDVKLHTVLDNYKNNILYFVYHPNEGIYIDTDNQLYLYDKKADIPFKVTYAIKAYKYNLNNFIVGGYDGNLILWKNGKVLKKYKNIKGNIVKLIRFDRDNFFGVVTDEGEFAIFNINKKEPVKVFPNFTYPFVDIKQSDNYVLLVNRDYSAYLLLKKVLFKGGLK